MDCIDKIRSLTETVQECMNELATLQKQLSECIEAEQFVSDILKQSLIDKLNELELLKRDLKFQIESLHCTTDINGLSDIRRALDEITKAEYYNQLVRQLECVVMEDDEDRQKLSELIETINKAVNHCDYNNQAIAIGMAFINDLKNQKVAEMKTVKEFKNVYAFLRISVYEGSAVFDENLMTDVVSENVSESDETGVNTDDTVVIDDNEDDSAGSVSVKEEEIAPTYEESEAKENNVPCFIQSEPNIIFSVEEKKVKKKFSVTECLNLMTVGKYSNERKPIMLYHLIVKIIDVFGAFSLDFFKNMSHDAPKMIEAEMVVCIKRLLKTDVLRMFASDKKELYYLSENGKKLFENKTFRQVFFKNMGLQSRHCGEKFEANKWNIAASLAFEEIYLDFTELYDDLLGKSDGKMLPGFRMFEFKNSSNNRYFLTAFMYFDTSVLDEYKKLLFSDDSVKDNDKVCLFILASTDFDKCRFIFSQTEDEFYQKYPDTKVIFFSFNDNKYYDAVSDKELLPEDIISEFSVIAPESDETEIECSDETVSVSEASQDDPDHSDSPNEDSSDSSADKDCRNEVYDEENTDMDEENPPSEIPCSIESSDEDDSTDSETAAETDEEKSVVQEKYGIENKPVKVCMRYIPYDDAVNKAEEMIISGAEYSALAYLKIVSTGNSEIIPLYELTALALDDPMVNKHYSSNEILSLVDKIDLEDIFVQSLMISAAMRTFFYNDSQFDYEMRALNNILPRTAISDIYTFIQACIDFKTKHSSGFDLYCDYRNKEQISARKEIEDICKKAKDLYNAAVDSPFREKTKIKRYRDTVQKIFSRDSLLAEFLKIVAQNAKSEIEFAREYISDYIKGNTIDTCNINEDEIDQLIDNTWDICCEDKVLYHSTPLVGGPRAKLKNRIKDALIYIIKWVHNNDICDAIGRTADDNEKTFMLKRIAAIKNACQQTIAESRSNAVSAGYSCIRFTCDNLLSRVNGSYDGTAYKKFFYINMLLSGDVMLRENENGAYVPDLSDYCYGVSGYTIEDRILRNYEQFANTNGFEKEHPDFDDQNYCDLQAAEILIDYYASKDYETSEMLNSLNRKLLSSKEYEKQLNKQRIGFIEELELKKSYGVFDANNDDDIKELLLRQSDEIYHYSIYSRNYGFYKRALDFIRIQIEADSKIQKDKISNSLNELLSDEIIIEKETDDPVLKDSLAKAKLYIESGNYTAAEDLINRIISGDLSSIELKAPNPDLANFQKCYGEMYDACYSSSGAELKSSVKTKKLIERYTRAMKDAKSANRLASLWISNSTNENKMQELLSMLGMDCVVSSEFEKGNYNHGKYYFDCILKGNVNTSGRFSHVVAPFGSLAHTVSFRTLCLFGKNDDERLFNEIDKLTSFKKSTIIFVDYIFNEPFRRELSDRIKRGKYGEIYMVVDRVMFLYFVTHYQTESIIGKFINVAMPYSYYQPYVYDSMSKMPPEMFFGRTDELQKIEDKNGIHLLYGGRQLGKSALLRRAELSVNGISGQRALYIDIKSKTVREVAEMICDEMISLGLFDKSQIYDDWRSLCKAIKETITDNQIKYFLLLLDEGDKFIADCAQYNYLPIEEMKRIMQSVDFKFVIAGLHNLVRYDHKSAVSDNSVIPHLKTLTIKPFKNMEARKLLEVPLAQVGLFFNNDALISTILATTNYFPGLIQLYCSKLITSLQDIDKTIYPVIAVPPYYINEKHIQKILANEEFTEQIKEKFEITLELDNDNYYQIIALLMAEMYHSDDVMNHSVGYGADEVYARGCDYGIQKIYDLSLDVFTVYMDELVELNIFRKHPDNSYTFLRQNFFQLMGNSDEIYDRLQKYMDS